MTRHVYDERSSVCTFIEYLQQHWKLNNNKKKTANYLFKTPKLFIITKSTRATYKNIPAVMDNIQGVVSSSELLIATPMNIPMMAVMAEREL